MFLIRNCTKNKKEGKDKYLVKCYDIPSCCESSQLRGETNNLAVEVVSQKNTQVNANKTVNYFKKIKNTQVLEIYK